LNWNWATRNSFWSALMVSIYWAITQLYARDGDNYGDDLLVNAERTSYLVTRMRVIVTIQWNVMYRNSPLKSINSHTLLHKELPSYCKFTTSPRIGAPLSTVDWVELRLHFPVCLEYEVNFTFTHVLKVSVSNIQASAILKGTRCVLQ
jgi:hypothetical protein